MFFELRMNSSVGGQVDSSSRDLFVLSVNISIFFVVLAFLCHLTAMVALLRPELRRKTFTPFMINICVISVVQVGCRFSLTLGNDKEVKSGNENAKKETFLCIWTAFVGLLSQCAYSSTVCAMSAVSKITLNRCSRGLPQTILGKTKVIVFAILWIYPLVVSGIPFSLEDPFGPSASGLMCQLRWSSKESKHNFYNSFASIALFFLPMVICFKTQYDFSR